MTTLKKILLVLGANFVFNTPALAEFVVKDVEATLKDRDIQVFAKVELNLSEQAELAIDNGVPLVVITEFELMRDGWLWDETIVQQSNARRLRYHSLSGRYVVESLDANELQTYGSVADALRGMGTLRSVIIKVPHDLPAPLPELTLAVRSRLDLNDLPPPMRPLALFSPSWRLSSDWTTWQIVKP